MMRYAVRSGNFLLVTSIGSRSWPDSIVARNAFFISSVMMYSRCTGTWANSASDSTETDEKDPG